jgi:hypothetical protein
MKKIGLMVAIIAFIVSMLAVSTPKSVQAYFIHTPNPEVWDTGTEVVVDLTVNPAPNEWLQLLSKGTVISEPGTICRPFHKGPYGWTGAIYQLVDGNWVKLDTTFAWIPDKEGVYTACAVAPAAGTYALFGYFDPALAPVDKKTPEPL